MDDSTTRLQLGLRMFLSAGFAFAGVMHFVKPDPFLSIMPGWVPYPDLAVAVSGIAEIAGAVGLLFAQTRRAAAYGLILLLVAVFPANINMALNSQKFPQIPVALLWMRLPIQFILIWLVYQQTIKVAQPSNEGS